MKKKIGSISIQPGETRTRHFECAAWYEEIELAPGTYDVFGLYKQYGYGHREDLRGQWYLDSLGYSVPGTIISDNFQSLFCGNPIGKAYDSTQNAGKPTEWSAWGIYPFAVAKAILDGESPIVLDAGYEARPKPFVYQGEEKVTYEIVEKSHE